MELTEKQTGLLGLAQRAGQLTFGFEAAERSLQSGRLRLLILARDLAASRAAKLEALAARTGTPFLRLGTKASLGSCLGRSDAAIIGVVSPDFAEGLLS